MNERDIEQDTKGRTVTVDAYGKDLLSLEMAALDAARKFFGPEIHLEIIPEYEASYLAQREPDLQFYARVGVREVTAR